MGQILDCLCLRTVRSNNYATTERAVVQMTPRNRSLVRRPKRNVYIGPQVGMKYQAPNDCRVEEPVYTFQVVV